MLGARNSYTNQTLTLKGSLVGESTTALRVCNRIVNGIDTDITEWTTVKIDCDCSGYYGSISVTSSFARTSSKFGAALSFASVTMPGSVIVQNDGVLRTVSKTDIATVGSLSFEPGSCIALQAGTVSSKLTNGFFRVTDSFFAAGPVTVTIPSSVVPTDGTSSRFPIVEMPLVSTVSTNDFIGRFSDAASVVPQEWLHFEVDEAETCKRLVLVAGPVPDPVVKQTVADRDTYSPGFDSSLTNASHWSNQDVPRSGTNYLVESGSAARLRTISNTSLDYVFEGDSLTFMKAAFFLFCHSFTVPVFRGYAASVATGSKLPVGVLCANRFEFGGSTTYLVVQIGGFLELNGPIYGCGTLLMRGNNTYGSNGRVWLNGDNSNFRGKIRLTVGKATPNDTDIFQTLYVANGNNLGGALDKFAYDALSLEAYAVLCTTNGSVTLESGLNRGLYVNNVARIRAEAGHTLTVNWPLTLNGTLRKEGEGNLLLGGDALFTPVGGVPAATPTADANIVAVKAGGIGVNAAESLNGMALQFEPGGKLICNADATDADLKARGLVNTKAATPFAVADGLDKIPLQIESAEMPAAGIFTLRVATVSAGQASAMQGLMGRVKLPAAWSGYRATWLEPAINGNDGTATLAIAVKRHGFCISFR